MKEENQLPEDFKLIIDGMEFNIKPIVLIEIDELKIYNLN
jgi:hypothetical protein